LLPLAGKRPLKLESMGIKIDRLSPEREEYLAGWSEGT
jgi:S-adenosylhomocysteine hydrolase